MLVKKEEAATVVVEDRAGLYSSLSRLIAYLLELREQTIAAKRFFAALVP